MLPPSVETPRLKELMKISNEASPEEISKWPELLEKDYLLVGAIVILYSYIDLDLRRIADIEDVVLSLPDWSEPNTYALNHIKKMRAVRNLVAHFAIRRFPNDDAFIFVTKSARDFRRYFGTDPEPGAVLSAVAEREQVKQALLHIQGLHTWLSKTTPTIEKMFLGA